VQKVVSACNDSINFLTQKDTFRNLFRNLAWGEKTSTWWPVIMAHSNDAECIPLVSRTPECVTCLQRVYIPLMKIKTCELQL